MPYLTDSNARLVVQGCNGLSGLECNSSNHTLTGHCNGRARAQEFAADPQIKAAAEAAGAVSPGRNIALAACGDGVVPGKKQKQQLYPIVFQVLNLPPWARSRMENFIICTVIDGHKAHADLQPTMEVAVDELLWMYWEGVSMVAQGSSDTFTTTKALLLDTRYDLPGLAQAFRLAGGNPYLGACPTCCQPGLRCGTKPIYPCESWRATMHGVSDTMLDTWPLCMMSGFTGGDGITQLPTWCCHCQNLPVRGQ